MSDAVLSQFTPEKEVETKKDEKILKAGFIGTGWIATAYAPELKKMEDIKVVAMADLIPGKAERFAEKYEFEDVHFYPNGNAMIDAEDLDMVFVCTYNTQHAPCAIYALNHGVNVLLEKPFTVTLDEAVAVCRAEKESGKLLSIGFQPRMDENMKMIKKIVDSGELGKVYYIQTGGGRRRGIPNSTFIEKRTAGIGALGDIGCYSLDLVLKAVGYPKPLTATGYTSSYFGANPKWNNPEDAARFDVDDFAAGFIRLEGDIILDFRIAWAMNINTPGDTIILGTEGGLRVPSTDAWNGSFDKPMTVYKQIGGAEIEYEVPLQFTWNGLFYSKIRSFADAVKYGGKAPVPSSEILYNQAIIDGLVRSAQLGHEIEIEIPEI